jgi:uncharacterized membrane protein HdeD (DUF308 family)
MSVPETSMPSEPAGSPPGGEQVGPPPERTGPRRADRWILLILGLLTVLYGLLVMSLRPAALFTVAVLAGIAFIAGGISQLAVAGRIERSWRWLAYLGGVIGIAAGIAAFVWPALTLVVLAIVTAWALVINGVVRIVASVAGRDRELWWLALLAGVVELLLGLWALGSPGRELLLLVNLIGIYLVIVGVDSMVSAFVERSPGRGDPGRDDTGRGTADRSVEAEAP